MDIKFEDIENQSYKDIVKVAKSMGVQSNGKKSSILERIKYNIDIMKSQKQKQQQQQQQQQQQKEPMDNNEILFWKSFKNIFIRTKILNFIKSTKKLDVYINSFSYYQIDNVEWMLVNGHSQLLRSKVLNGEYLTFSCTILQKNKKYSTANNKQFKKQSGHIILDDQHYQYSIFNSPFKNDRLFQSKLLSNYPKYFKPTTNEMMVHLQRFSIEYDNVALLQVLIEDYGLKLVNPFKIFEQSIEIGSTEIANYVFSEYSIKTNETIDNKLWRIALKSKDTDEIGWNNLNIFVDLFTNKLPIAIPSKILNESIGPNIFDLVIYRLPLKSLLECCFTIVYLKPIFQTFINSLENGKWKMKISNDQSDNDAKLDKFKILSIEELNKINEIYTSMEMNSIVGKFPASDEKVKSLFNMLIMFTFSGSSSTGYSKISDNYKFYKAKYYSTYYSHPSNKFSGKVELQPYQFGDHCSQSTYRCDKIPVEVFKCHFIRGDLFEHCDKEKQISFIKICCQDITDGGSVTNINEMLEYYLTLDDIEMLELIFMELKKNNQSLNGFPRFCYYFKSTKSFEIFLKNCPLVPNQSIGSIEDQIQVLIGELGHNFYFYKYFESKYPIEISRYHQLLYSNYNKKKAEFYIYLDWVQLKKSMDSDSFNEMYYSIWQNKLSNFGYPLFKLFIIKNNKLINPPPTTTGYKLSDSYGLRIKEIGYLLKRGNENVKNDLKSGLFINSKSNEIIKASYLLNGLDDFIGSTCLETLIQQYTLEKVLESTINQIIQDSDIQLLSHLLSRFQSPISNETVRKLIYAFHIEVYDIEIPRMKCSSREKLRRRVSNGNARVLDHLLTNFKSLFDEPVYEKGIINYGDPVLLLLKLFVQDGNSECIDLILGKLGIDRFNLKKRTDIPVTFTQTNNNFYMSNFFKTYYPNFNTFKFN